MSLPTVEKLAFLLRQTLVWLEHPEFNALPLCGSPSALAAHVRETLSGVCSRCYGEMRPGKAMKQTLRGFADFPGGDAVTLSPGGPGVLIDCMKCHKCGYSVTGVMDAYEQTDATANCCELDLLK